MELPPGTVDPIFQCELALELKMSVTELMHGRGTPMSAHEFGVLWPAYFRNRARVRRQEEEEQRRSMNRRRSRV